MRSWTAIGTIALGCAMAVVGCGSTQSTGNVGTPTAAPTATATPNATATPKGTTTPTPKPTGPTLTQQQQNAVAEAQQYLSTEAFSQQGLIDQLDSADGGEFTVAQATAAVDGLTTNWNSEAVQSAKQYLSTEAFSCNDLIAQLDSPDGGQFTVAQATYGAQQAGAC